MLQLIPEWFRQTKEGQRVVRETVAEATKTRTQLLEQIAQRRRELESTQPRADARLEKAWRVYQQSLLAARALEAEVNLAIQERMSIVQGADSAIARAERQLRDGADPRIGEFVAEWTRNEDLLRAGMSAGGVTDPAEYGIQRHRAIIECVREAIRRAVALQLAASPDVGAELAALADEVRAFARARDAAPSAA